MVISPLSDCTVISSLYVLDRSLSHRSLKPGVVASIAWKSWMHDKARAGQVVLKCSSSSTAFLHNYNLQNL